MIPAERLSVVVFSGGRGSSVLSEDLMRRADIQLTLAINGYDDGMSTGEVRRFLGDSLGPSDFRKNASHLARRLCSCPLSLVDLLDLRLPADSSTTDALAFVRGRTQASELAVVADRFEWFARELQTSGKRFDFADCSVGNLVFAGCFLRGGRRFNHALDDYCALLGLEPGVVENVSDGTDAHLVALDLGGQLLASEADIVDATRHNRIADIHLLARRLTQDEQAAFVSMTPEEQASALGRLERSIPANPRLLKRIATADLIVYSAGTQHSSLFPSYLTQGLSAAIGGNLKAVKLLITNIQSDAEIAGATAVEIIEKAVYYLREKGRRPLPTPCLITHYVLNDPRGSDHAPYVPLGRLDSIEDPRLVRIGNYEDGVSGRHDAGKVLGPFIQSLLPQPRQRVALWLYDADSPNKVAQTLLELVRARIHSLPLEITAFYGGAAALDVDFVATLPFAARHVGAGASSFAAEITPGRFDYVILFESSGMYNGEDVASLAAYLTSGRLDSVWGSRRLSVRDIEASIRLQYEHRPLLRAASFVGSHLLSVAYLLLYGRYVSDTLSGARGLRVRYCAAEEMSFADQQLNQKLLSRLLLDRAEMLEIPVQFYPMSPGKVRRTTVMDGLRALALIAARRLSTGETLKDTRKKHGKNTEETL